MSLKLLRSLAGLVFALCVVLLLGNPQAQAGTLYSTGFENPPFQLGPIDGQDGWICFCDDPSPAFIENDVFKSGKQAVGVNGSVVNQTGPFHEDFTNGPLVELQADVFLASAASQSAWQFAGLGSNLAPFIGGIDTDPNNNIYLITAGFPIVGTLTRDAWHHLDFVFDFNTQKYSFALDGVTLASNAAFCGDNGPCNGAHVGFYADGLFDTFGNGTDFGYMDNYSVSTPNAVPEPGTFMMLASGLLGGAAMMRRRIGL